MNARLVRNTAAAGLGLLGVLFISTIMLSNAALNEWRLDLTEQQLYTISDGTRKVLEEINQPVNLYFFFSDKVSAEDAFTRNYARRVRELLEEYTHYASGKLNLQVIDPVPYSEQEDRATGLGLQAVPLGNGENLYFGLAGTNSVDDVEIIPFFQPDRETFLEYDISQLIYTLLHPVKPVVGVLTGLQTFGSFDPARQQPIPEWAIISQIKQLFEVRQIRPEASAIDPEVSILMLIHPKQLSVELQYAVDQFALRGGRLILFFDPYADQDPMFQQASDPPEAGGIQASDFTALLQSWGLVIDPEQMAADRAQAMPVQGPDALRPVRHVSIIATEEASLNPDNIITAQLSRVTFAFPGHIRTTEEFTGTFEPLIQTSSDARQIEKKLYRYLPDPSTLLEGFKPEGKPLTLAARVRVVPQALFPDGPPPDVEAPASGHLSQAQGPLDAIVLADSDMLGEHLWTRTQDFFGQRILRPWAGNGDFIINALESLGGSSDLIDLRGRAEFSRPFHVVQTLRLEAENRFRLKEKQLRERLQEAEENIHNLEQFKQQGGEQTLLTEKQQAEINAYRQELLRVRGELRSVRHELDRDIEQLGTVLRVINILLIPLLVTLLAINLWVIQRRRRQQRYAA